MKFFKSTNNNDDVFGSNDCLYGIRIDCIGCSKIFTLEKYNYTGRGADSICFCPYCKTIYLVRYFFDTIHINSENKTDRTKPYYKLISSRSIYKW